MSVLPVQFEEKAITYLLAYDPCTIKGWWKLAWPFFKPDGTGLNWDNSSSVSAFEYFNHWNKHRISDYRYIPFLLIPCHQRMHQWLEGASHFCSTLWWRFQIKYFTSSIYTCVILVQNEVHLFLGSGHQGLCVSVTCMKKTCKQEAKLKVKCFIGLVRVQ